VTQRWAGGGRTVPVVAETLKAAMEREFGAANIAYAQGCKVLPDTNQRTIYFEDSEPMADPSKPLLDLDTSGIPAAVALAKQSDIAIVAVGDRAGLFATGTVGEGCDVDDLRLPGVQADLVDAILDTGTPTIVVLLAGRPYDLRDVANRAKAVIFAGFPGGEGAAAIARVLSGKVNPSGKLTVTFPPSAGAEPMFYNRKILSVGLPRAEYYEATYPFGFGQSYTTFAYADLKLDKHDWPIGQRLAVSCTITNTGRVAGDEIVQLYVTDPVGSTVRPIIELKGFHRVRLEPGESRRVSFDIHSDLLSFTDGDYRRVVEPGEVILKVGASSADIRLEAKVRMTGVTAVTPPDREMVTHTSDTTAKT
jgi:hypothetical protein